MNVEKYEITPFSITTTYTVNSISISVIKLELNKSAVASAILYDENGKIVDNKLFNITGEIYNNWIGDDSYVINYIAEQLGSSYKLK